MTDYVIEHENLTDGGKKLVGLYQEARLAQDESGGEDGMWFDEAVAKVRDDADAAVEFVSANWPHGKVTVADVRKHCGL
ncbi:hypothetical protein ELZ19_07010 [Brucella abortus]|uniref:hypothetical protein n=1 Tax=Brucella abortus TaxID=235 RepID=UPI000A57EF5B|nr:hypothetical protein [Brucella abortus]RUQ67320.1 hypothetical protein ELZ23_15440 [Brucella abortus]RUQ78549.1 hypothetical protein ELZ22_16885 [Brucella abortus]RUQ88291.1 hypothetical protein ELZ18_15640 [Brucella abortus]RUQ90321.1 hypothetical protein ELZ20_15640 [Brucella abortus]RUQ96487.1 hypothetical protein ELZ21_15340 [Brucella abortus]